MLIYSALFIVTFPYNPYNLPLYQLQLQFSFTEYNGNTLISKYTTQS